MASEQKIFVAKGSMLWVQNRKRTDSLDQRFFVANVCFRWAQTASGGLLVEGVVTLCTTVGVLDCSDFFRNVDQEQGEVVTKR